MVEVYTDGSCLGNPGKGGWGAIIKWEDGETQIWGSSTISTNNEMELTAAYNACKELVKNNIQTATIYTDSTYVKNGITIWIKNWIKNGFQTANKKEIKNKNIWKLLYEENEKINNISWVHVKAHNGDYMNERVDTIARNAAINQN